MPQQQIPDTSMSYALICFDRDGIERADDNDAFNGRFSQTVIEDVRAHPTTDIFIFCHGWKGDVKAAISQYNAWIGALGKQENDHAALRARPGGFMPMFIGLHWPSLPWGDEGLGLGANFALQNLPKNHLVEFYAERLGDKPEIRAALSLIVEEARTNAVADTLTEAARSAYVRLNQALELGENKVGAPQEMTENRLIPTSHSTDHLILAQILVEAALGARFCLHCDSYRSGQ